jgi:ribosomal protein S18 acetylase RimI-like enzyme
MSAAAADEESGIAPDAWLADVMRRPVFRVRATAEAAARVAAHSLAQPPGTFYFAKLPTSDVALLRRFTEAGFEVVDTAITLHHDRDIPPSLTSVTVREVREEDEEAVVAIATRAFHCSRFHLDPRIEPEVAQAIKGEWVRNYCRGLRGDRLFVATLPGLDRPIGFLAALQSGECAVLDLIAVDAGVRRNGVGAALVSAFLAAYRPRFRTVVVGTQVANVSSIRLYERLGFVFARSEYVVHKHVTR